MSLGARDVHHLRTPAILLEVSSTCTTCASTIIDLISFSNSTSAAASASAIVQSRQADVGEQRDKNCTLRGPSRRLFPGPGFGENFRISESLHQRADAFIGDP